MNTKKLQQTVLQVIQDNPGVENDDCALIAAIWRTQGWSDVRSLEDNIERVTRPESISRARRKLHELGLISYSQAAHEMRYDAFKHEQNKHSTYEQTMARIVGVRYREQIVDGEIIMVQE